MKKSLIIITIFLVLFSDSVVFAQAQSDSQNLILLEAIKKRKVKLVTQKRSPSEITFKIISSIENPVTISVPAGTYFVDRGTYFNDKMVHNNFITTEDLTLDLTQEKELIFTVPVVSAYLPFISERDKFDDLPVYDVGKSFKTEDFIKILSAIKVKNPDFLVKQVAMWIVTEDVWRGKLDSNYEINPPEDSRPKASDTNVIKAIQLVDEAGINIREKTLVKEKESIIKALSIEDISIQQYASKLLGMEGKNRVDILIQMLKDENPKARKSAAWALGRIKPNLAVLPLINSLKDKDSQVRCISAEALGEIKDEQAIVPLITLFRYGDYFSEITARAAGKVENNSLEHLLKALKDENHEVKTGAILALGETGNNNALEFLISALQDKEPSIKARAAQALGKLGNKKAVEYLITCLKDENEWVRKSAVQSLGELEDNRAIEPLIDSGIFEAKEAFKKIGTPAIEPLVKALEMKKNNRLVAVLTLGEIKDRAAIEPLINALKDDDKVVRENAGKALLNIGVSAEDKRALELLVNMLKDKDAEVRMNAVWVLGNLEDKDNKMIEPLMDCLRDENPSVRQRTAYLIGKRRNLCTIELLISALKNSDPEVRKNAVFSLGEIGDDRATEPIISLLKGSDPGIRWNAIDALAKIGSREAVKQLITEYMDEKDDQRRIRDVIYEIKDSDAVEFFIYTFKSSDVLSRIGTPAVEPLIIALKDTDSQVRILAACALGKIRDDDAVEPLMAILNDEINGVRSSSTRALGEIGDIRAVPILINMLKDKTPDVRKYAAEALGNIKDNRATEPLITALEDENSDVRRKVAWALGKLKDNRAIEPLINLFKDKNVREDASSAVGEIGKPAVELLLNTLKNKDPIVRLNGAWTLAKIRDNQATEALIELLKDENSDVRGCAAGSLGQIRDVRAIEPLINLLEDKNQQVQFWAPMALKNITGKWFKDINEWREWWEKNKEYYK